jgi:hypothetical protein
MWSDLWFLQNEFVLSLFYILLMSLLIVLAALLSKVLSYIAHRFSSHNQATVQPLIKQH